MQCGSRLDHWPQLWGVAPLVRRVPLHQEVPCALSSSRINTIYKDNDDEFIKSLINVAHVTLQIKNTSLLPHPQKKEKDPT